MYNSEATASTAELNWVSLLICWLIILGGYLLIRMVFLVCRAAAAPDRSGHLPCAAAVLLRGAVSMEVLQESGTAGFTRLAFCSRLLSRS